MQPRCESKHSFALLLRLLPSSPSLVQPKVLNRICNLLLAFPLCEISYLLIVLFLPRFVLLTAPMTGLVTVSTIQAWASQFIHSFPFSPMYSKNAALGIFVRFPTRTTGNPNRDGQSLAITLIPCGSHWSIGAMSAGVSMSLSDFLISDSVIAVIPEKFVYRYAQGISYSFCLIHGR